MNLTTLAVLAATLLVIVPQAFADEDRANLEGLNYDPAAIVTEPAQVVHTIGPDQPEPAILENDVRGTE